MKLGFLILAMNQPLGGRPFFSLIVEMEIQTRQVVLLFGRSFYLRKAVAQDPILFTAAALSFA